MSKQNSESKEDKINSKFDFLVQELNKNVLENNKTFEELENVLQNKYTSFKNKISSKIFENCKNEIDIVKLYTEYSPSFNPNSNEVLNRTKVENLKPVKGHESDFSQALDKFQECTDQFSLPLLEVEYNSEVVTSLTEVSNNICVEKCRSDLLKLKCSETEVRKCLDACLRYKKYNLMAYYSNIIGNIDSTEKALEKI